MSPRGTSLLVVAPDGVPEVEEGDDLGALLLDALADAEARPGPLPGGLRDGDVVVVTSKVVSKAEGRVRDGDSREELLAAQTDRVLARRGPTTIVRTPHGLVLAAAGIDNSNVRRGRLVLLPEDPDASARRLRAALQERTGRRLAVVVTDTAGRAWREGQTDLAIGAAGLQVAESYAGSEDGYGNPLAVTAPAVADEIAGAAELAQGKLGGRPFAVVRGRADLVLEDDGPGAVALVRPEGADLFGYGAREAVVRALAADPATRGPFGAPASPEELAAAVRVVTGEDPVRSEGPDGPSLTCTAHPALAPLAFAHGWALEPGVTGARLRPAAP